MKRLTDPTFRYVPAALTDIRATFKRVRRELAEAKAAEEKSATVTPIAKRKSAP